MFLPFSKGKERKIPLGRNIYTRSFTHINSSVPSALFIPQQLNAIRISYKDLKLKLKCYRKFFNIPKANSAHSIFYFVFTQINLTQCWSVKSSPFKKKIEKKRANKDFAYGFYSFLLPSLIMFHWLIIGLFFKPFCSI